MTVNPSASAVPSRTTRTDVEANAPHILLVDSDPHSLENGKRLLEDLGYRVTACETPEKALVEIHTTTEKFICIVSDLSMPRIGGLELANTSRLCRPGTPFLLTSAGVNSLSADYLRTIGIHGYILKPFSARTLAETLKRALTGHSF